MNPTKPLKPAPPAGAEEAVRKMIEITREMKELSEVESGTLGTGDLEAMNKLIALKGPLSTTYEQAGQEFHKRIAEFKDVDPALLLELKDEQGALQMFIQHNGAYYEAAAKMRGGKK